METKKMTGIGMSPVLRVWWGGQGATVRRAPHGRLTLHLVGAGAHGSSRIYLALSPGFLASILKNHFPDPVIREIQGALVRAA